MAVEADRPFDGYSPELFPRLTKVADWIVEKLSPISHVELCLSEHLNTGGSPTIDSELYDLPDLVVLGDE